MSQIEFKICRKNHKEQGRAIEFIIEYIIAQQLGHAKSYFTPGVPIFWIGCIVNGGGGADENSSINKFISKSLVIFSDYLIN